MRGAILFVLSLSMALLVQGCSGGAGSVAMSTIFSITGMSQRPGPAVMAQIAEIKNILSDMKTSINIVQSLIAEIDQDVAQTDYDILVKDPKVLVDKIKDTMVVLYQFASLTPEKYQESRSYWDKVRSQISSNLKNDLIG